MMLAGDITTNTPGGLVAYFALIGAIFGTVIVLVIIGMAVRGAAERIRRKVSRRARESYEARRSFIREMNRRDRVRLIEEGKKWEGR